MSKFKCFSKSSPSQSSSNFINGKHVSNFQASIFAILPLTCIFLFIYVVFICLLPLSSIVVLVTRTTCFRIKNSIFLVNASGLHIYIPSSINVVDNFLDFLLIFALLQYCPLPDYFNSSSVLMHHQILSLFKLPTWFFIHCLMFLFECIVMSACSKLPFSQ